MSDALWRLVGAVAISVCVQVAGGPLWAGIIGAGIGWTTVALIQPLEAHAR